MNKHGAVMAAREIMDELRKRGVVEQRDPEGKTLGHALWMAHEISDYKMDDRKTQRWLGYLQCLVIMLDVTTLDAERIRNESLKEEER